MQAQNRLIVAFKNHPNCYSGVAKSFLPKYVVGDVSNYYCSYKSFISRYRRLYSVEVLLPQDSYEESRGACPQYVGSPLTQVEL